MLGVRLAFPSELGGVALKPGHRGEFDKGLINEEVHNVWQTRNVNLVLVMPLRLVQARVVHRFVDRPARLPLLRENESNERPDA
jgi:hypothetical protein